MSNVRALPGATIPNEPNPNVVEKLEMLLKLAQSGEIRSLAFAYLNSEGTATTGWNHEANYFGMCGAVGYLMHRLNSE